MPIRSLPGFYEPFSSISHLLGAGVFAILGVILLQEARGHRGRMVCLGVYVFSTVFLLSMSGVYHMLQEGSTARAVLGRLDFAAIFVLIAGTHTPIQWLFFRGPARWLTLVVMWSAVATGVTLFSVYYEDVPPALGTAVFLLLGWFAGVCGLIVWKRLGTARIRLLIAGGVTYSVGAILLGLQWPTVVPGVIGFHELWHIAVLGAMAMHWRFFYHFARSGSDTAEVLLTSTATDS
ncbi:hemolysin-III related [Planctomycetes bacterium Poly30]|uniref:Hemolysin-III related n=1 Tax=Saltatorellus ferox TaxID=2528018 RepID=A0A518EYN6_9BACT|nr:hemolysin-III related [Planctomycetes bacterium Poly30]